MLPKKIMLVSDKEDVRHMLELYFNRGGSHVVSAASGKEALAAYHANPDVGLMILDTEFDTEKGWDVYDRLRGAGYAGFAIAMSGKGYRPEWMERGVPLAQKPLTGSQLEKKIMEHVKGFPQAVQGQVAEKERR